MRYFQRGASPSLFDANLAAVVKLPRYPETVWTWVYHLYRDNQDEVELARHVAEHSGFKFVVLPAIFMPLEKMVDGDYSTDDRELISHLIQTPEEAVSGMKKVPVCPLWKHITLDASTRVFLCELIYREEFVLGKFFDKPIHEWLSLAKSDPFCGKCIDKKANTMQLCYAEIATSKDPVGDANKKRMKG